MRARALMSVCITLLELTMSNRQLAAQEWLVSANAGRIRSAIDPAVTESFALGVGYDDAMTALRLSGEVPIRAEDALRGGASAWRRIVARRHGLVAGVDLSASGFLAVDRTSQPNPPPGGLLGGLFDPPVPVSADRSGHALAGQILPILGYETRDIQLHARAGVSSYSATFGSQTGDRTVRLADIELNVTPTGSLAIVPVLRRAQARGEDASNYAGISVVTASRSASAWASVGQWIGGPSAGTPWSAGARVALHPRLSLEGSVRGDTYDPLYLRGAQTSWSVGLSVPFAGQRRSVAAPVPSAYENGRATIRLAVSSTSSRPSIAGDFNEWKPAPMERDGDQWSYTVAVARGVYNYAFVGADGAWFVPKDVPGRKDDGMGGHVAVLVVR